MTNTHDTAGTASLRKQLMGAVVGTGIALGLYGVYSVATPALTGWLAGPADEAVASESKFTDADRATRQDEIAERARAIIERMRETE